MAYKILSLLALLCAVVWMLLSVTRDCRASWLDLCIWASKRRHGGFQ